MQLAVAAFALLPANGWPYMFTAASNLMATHRNKIASALIVCAIAHRALVMLMHALCKCLGRQRNNLIPANHFSLTHFGAIPENLKP